VGSPPAQRQLEMGTLHGAASDYPPDPIDQQRLSGVDVIVLEADLSRQSGLTQGKRAPGMVRRAGLDTRTTRA